MQCLYQVGPAGQNTAWKHKFIFLGFSEHSNRHSRQRVQVEELTARVSTLTQENRVLKVCLSRLFSCLYTHLDRG